MYLLLGKGQGNIQQTLSSVASNSLIRQDYCTAGSIKTREVLTSLGVLFSIRLEVLQELFLEFPKTLSKSVPIILWLRKTCRISSFSIHNCLISFYFIFHVPCFICYLKIVYSCKVCTEFNQSMYINALFSSYKLVVVQDIPLCLKIH